MPGELTAEVLVAPGDDAQWEGGRPLLVKPVSMGGFLEREGGDERPFVEGESSAFTLALSRAEVIPELALHHRPRRALVMVELIRHARRQAVDAETVDVCVLAAVLATKN